MQLLKINNSIVDIDEQTAIGLDIQSYDITNPGQRKINISNTFTIPKTSNNINILGWDGNIHNINSTIYNQLICDYYVDNVKLVSNAKIRIDQISDRISIFVFQKSDIWEQIKNYTFTTFQTEFFAWMVANNLIRHSGNKYSGTLGNFLNSELNSVYLLYYASNLASKLDENKYYIANSGDFSDYSGTVPGTTKVHYENHFLQSGDLIKFTDSGSVLISTLPPVIASYTGEYEITVIDNDNFYITKTYHLPDSIIFYELVSKYLETYDNIRLKYYDLQSNVMAKCGHFSVPIYRIFQFLQYKYNVNFNLTFPGNLFSYLDYLTVYLPIRNIQPRCDYTIVNLPQAGTGNTTFTAPKNTRLTKVEIYSNVDAIVTGSTQGYNKVADLFASQNIAAGATISINLDTYLINNESVYYTIFNLTSNPMITITRTFYEDSDDNLDAWYLELDTVQGHTFEPLTDSTDKGGKTMYDIINAFLQHFNVIIDEVETSSYIMRPFDFIINAPHVDWSGLLQGEKVFKPSIENLAQENIIKFKSIYPNGNELINSKKITCLNKNIDAKKDLFSINAHIPAAFLSHRDAGGQAVYSLDMSTKESFNENIFLTTTAQRINFNNKVNFIYQEYPNNPISTTVPQPYNAVLCNLSDQYNTYDTIVKYPVTFKIQKWLKAIDVYNLQFFRKYYFKELGGSFFLNKITGFNPQKSLNPTELELILIDRTAPLIGTFENYWVDGIGNYYVDGYVNRFIW